MLTEITTLDMYSIAVMFFFGFFLLFVIYYFTSPIYTIYGDKKSRLYYSLINSLYFSLMLTILFSVLTIFSSSIGMIASILVCGLAILVGTALQVYIIAELIKRDIIKMRQKRRVMKQNK